MTNEQLAAFFGAARTAAGIPSAPAVERCAAYGIFARSFRSCAAVQRIAEKPAAGCVPCAVGFCHTQKKHPVQKGQSAHVLNEVG